MENMDNAKKIIRDKKITDKYEIVKILMESAERLSNNGDEKKELVIKAYTELTSEAQAGDGRLKLLPVIPIGSIITIIEAFIYATKTVVEINKKTGIFDKIKDFFTNLFKKKTV